MGNVWYLDSEISFHITRNKEFFSNFEEKDLQMHIEMGDDQRYSTTDIDTIMFQRESGSPLTLKYVMHFPGLKNNLVLVSMLEECGYDVIFSKRNNFLLSHSLSTSEADWGFGEEPLQIGCARFCCLEHKSREGAELRPQ